MAEQNKMGQILEALGPDPSGPIEIEIPEKYCSISKPSIFEASGHHPVSVSGTYKIPKEEPNPIASQSPKP